MRVKEESEIAGLKLNISKTRIMASRPIISCQIEGEKRKQWQIWFSWVPKSLQTVTAAMKLNTHAPWKKHYDKPRQHIKKQIHHFINKCPYWCFWTVVLENTLKRHLDWIFFGRTDAEAEASILLPPDAKSWLIGKDSDAENNWRQKKRGRQRMKWLYSITDLMDMNLSKLWEIVKDTGAWSAAVYGVAKNQTQLSNWTTI